MIIEPTLEELKKDFNTQNVDFTIINTGCMEADKNIKDITSKTCVAFDYT